MNEIPLFENELYTKPYTTIAKSGHFPIHYHRHVEFIYVIKGQTCVDNGNCKKFISEGDAMFVSPYETHGYAPQSQDNCVLFKALMEPECLGTFGEILLKKRPVTPILSSEQLKTEFPDIQNKISSIAFGFSENVETKDYITNFSTLVSVLTKFLEISGIEPSGNEKNSVYVRAICYCCDHYTEEEISLPVISEALQVSTARLQQLFNQNLKMGVKEYINMLRMSKAETLLCESNVNIIDIAFSCGYGTVRSFNRAFQKVHNQTPTEYRKDTQSTDSAKNVRKILSNFELFYPSEWKNKNK